MSQVSRTQSKTKFETGDVPTEDDYVDLHDSVLWYDEAPQGVLVYVAEINRNQVSGNPIVTEIANTLGATPAWSKVNDTTFKVVLANGFVMGKTLATVTCIETDLGFSQPINNDNNTILVAAIHCVIKIEVYPST